MAGNAPDGGAVVTVSFGSARPTARPILAGMAEVENRHDIETRADCEQLVRAFYGRALVDPIIGCLFTDVAKLDLEAHVPRITNFWETILLGAHSYGGGAFRPHVELHFKVPLTRGHFDRWLYLWTTTVDELFAGERAELAKSHADARRRRVRVAAALLRRAAGSSSPPECPTANCPGGCCRSCISTVVRPATDRSDRFTKMSRLARGSKRVSSGLFRTQSDRLPASLPIMLLRWWIPGALCLIGVILLVADDFDTFGASAFGHSPEPAPPPG